MFLFLWNLCWELGVTILLLLFRPNEEIGESYASFSSRREFKLGLFDLVFTETPVFFTCFLVASFSWLDICCRYLSKTKTLLIFSIRFEISIIILSYKTTNIILLFHFLWHSLWLSLTRVSYDLAVFLIFRASDVRSAIRLVIQIWFFLVLYKTRQYNE